MSNLQWLTNADNTMKGRIWSYILRARAAGNNAEVEIWTAAINLIRSPV